MPLGFIFHAKVMLPVIYRAKTAAFYLGKSMRFGVLCEKLPSASANEFRAKNAAFYLGESMRFGVLCEKLPSASANEFRAKNAKFCTRFI